MCGDVQPVKGALPLQGCTMVLKNGNGIFAVVGHLCAPRLVSTLLGRGVQHVAFCIFDKKRHILFARMAQHREFLPFGQRQMVFSGLLAFKRADHPPVFLVRRKAESVAVFGVCVCLRRQATQKQTQP